MDSDGQHPAYELPRLIREVEKNDCDLVVGSILPDDNMPLIRKMGFHLLDQLEILLMPWVIKLRQRKL